MSDPAMDDDDEGESLGPFVMTDHDQRDAIREQLLQTNSLLGRVLAAL